MTSVLESFTGEGPKVRYERKRRGGWRNHNGNVRRSVRKEVKAKFTTTRSLKNNRKRREE